MLIDVLTLFPDMFAGVLGSSILKRAAEPVANPADPDDIRPPVVRYRLTDIRRHTASKHGKVDQPPYGGGPGLVMQCQPVWDAVQAVEAMDPEIRPRRVLMTPQGRPLTQPLAEQLARAPRLLVIAGHYEGIDERVIDRLREQGGLEEISIGDYVLSGGELPAMVLIDAVVRLIPGVLGDLASATQDSFSPGTDRLLDHPHYTRPAEWDGRPVPEVLRSGDHARIDAWRRETARRRTADRRPDLLDPARSVGCKSAGHDRPPLVTLRDEDPGDHDAVDTLHRAAFPEDVEARLVRELRRDGDAVISVVAETAGEVVGHVVLSPMQLADQPSIRGFLGLGPIAVRPDRQGGGIGTALVREALRRARHAAATAVFLVGSPDFYTRLGFERAKPHGFTCPYGDGPEFMIHPLRPVPEHHRGPLQYATAFQRLIPPDVS